MRLLYKLLARLQNTNKQLDSAVIVELVKTKMRKGTKVIFS
jgi:hypothetical protein